MHIAQLTMTRWEPESDYETWVLAIADKYPELKQCVMVAGDTVARCVALLIRDQDVIVHLEQTVCDSCGYKADCCAVPDFGVGDSDYGAFMNSLPRLSCPFCKRHYERRIVVWQAQLEQDGEQAAT